MTTESKQSTKQPAVAAIKQYSRKDVKNARGNVWEMSTVSGTVKIDPPVPEEIVKALRNGTFYHGDVQPLTKRRRKVDVEAPEVELNMSMDAAHIGIDKDGSVYAGANLDTEEAFIAVVKALIREMGVETPVKSIECSNLRSYGYCPEFNGDASFLRTHILKFKDDEDAGVTAMGNWITIREFPYHQFDEYCKRIEDACEVKEVVEGLERLEIKAEESDEEE